MFSSILKNPGTYMMETDDQPVGSSRPGVCGWSLCVCEWTWQTEQTVNE